MIEPDVKDWTWVLRERCRECGFDTREPGREDLAALVVSLGDRWSVAMSGLADARRRPAPATWSPLEYSCHVRDVFDLASLRVRLMIDDDDPLFANWDQDATAVDDDYATQDPVAVTAQVVGSARGFGAVVGAVPDDAWERTGRRGDGADFTIDSFVRYLVHDPIHHLTDITGRRWEG